jgi:type I restriction enzyme S subunit
MTNFTKDGRLNFSDVAYLDVEAKALEKRRLLPGDLILEKSGGGPNQPVGRVALFECEDADFSFSNFTAALRVADPSELDYRYLHRFLFWLHLSGGTEGIQSHSTNIRNLNMTAYKAVRVPIPSLAEQRRLVAILDEAFKELFSVSKSVHAAQERSAAVAQSERERVFAQFEGRMKVPLAELLSEQPRNGWSPPAVYQTGSGTPVLTLSSVTGFEFDGGKHKLSSAPTKAGAHYWLQEGELLVTRANTPQLVGHAAICHGLQQRTICPDLIMKMTLDPRRADARFIHQFMKTRAVRDYMTTHAVGANPTMVKISKSTVQQTLVPAPGLHTQMAIARHLDDVERASSTLAATYQRKLALLDEIKRSLLHEAFSGNL